MMKVNSPFLLPLALVLSLASCGEPKPQEQGEVADNSKEQPEALVFVDGSPISIAEFESAKSRFNVGGAVLDAKFDNTLLDSLISSRAMSRLAVKQMDDESLRKLELKTAAYREELLVKEYLRQHASPVPVSESMVREYYEKHPEEFSGGVKKAFEYFMTSEEDVTEVTRKIVLDFYAAAGDNNDWGALLGERQDLPVVYRKGKARIGVLKDPLKALVASTAPGELSSIHMGEQIVIVRVLAEEAIPAKPLVEVSADIRKRLAPMQLRKAVKDVSELAMKQVTVTYPKGDNK